MKTYIDGVDLDMEADAPVFAQVEVAGAVTEEAAIASVKATLSGEHFMVTRHTCKHEEGESCTSVDLEEVGG
jgi:hypothetical protein